MKGLLLSGLLSICTLSSKALLQQQSLPGMLIDSIALSDSLHRMAILHAQNGSLVTALQCWEQNIAILKNSNNKKSLAESYRMAGMLYASVGSVEKGMDDLSKALRISTELKDSLGIAQVQQCLGDVGLMQQNFQDAILHYVLGYIFIPYGNDVLRAQFLSKEGYSYEGAGHYDLALSYYKRSLKIYSEKNDTIGIAKALNDVGNIYKINGEIDTALYYFQRSASLYEQINDSTEIDVPLRHIAASWLVLNNSDKALMSALKSYDFALKTGKPTKIRDAAKSLSDVHQAKNNYEQSLRYFRQYTSMKDSLLNDKNKSVILSTRINFELEQEQQQSKEEKDNLNAIASLQARNQLTIIYIIMGALVITLLIAFLLFRNFNHKKKSEMQLLEKNAIIEQQKQRAEKSEAFKSQFLANMSHEIRTPMTAVLGFINLMFDETNEEKRLEYLSAIKKSSENLLVIINDILDLAKLETGKVLFEKIPFRLRDHINLIFETFKSQAASKGIKFKVTFAENIPEYLNADPVRMNQVIMNLVGNAIKFTRSGAVLLAIERNQAAVNYRQDSDCILHFNVTDTGIGIPVEQIEKIFDSFIQAHISDNRIFGGTGLGLTISKKLATAMGGDIKVQSEHEVGSTFTFVIPVEIATNEQWRKQQKNEFAYEEDIGCELQNISILVAEDNPYNNLMICDTLRKYIPGVKITEAWNGREVLKKINTGISNSEIGSEESNTHSDKHQPIFDVILLDIQMPEMDGYETAFRIRNLADPNQRRSSQTDLRISNHSIPIIALTASVIRSDIEKCLDVGMNGYVPKPFKSAELLNEIARVLGKDTSQYMNEETNPNLNNKRFQLLNQWHLNEISNGDTQQLRKYFTIFLEILALHKFEIKHALDNNNWPGLRAAAHALRPVFASIGNTQAETISRLIEENYQYEPKPVNEVLLLLEACMNAELEINHNLENITPKTI